MRSGVSNRDLIIGALLSIMVHALGAHLASRYPVHAAAGPTTLAQARDADRAMTLDFFELPPPSTPPDSPVPDSAPDLVPTVLIPPPISPPEPEVSKRELELGIAESPQRTPNWLGFADPTPHLAPRSEVTQPELDTNPGAPGLPGGAIAAGPSTTSTSAPSPPSASPNQPTASAQPPRPPLSLQPDAPAPPIAQQDPAPAQAMPDDSTTLPPQQDQANLTPPPTPTPPLQQSEPGEPAPEPDSPVAAEPRDGTPAATPSQRDPLKRDGTDGGTAERPTSAPKDPATLDLDQSLRLLSFEQDRRASALPPLAIGPQTPNSTLDPTRQGPSPSAPAPIASSPQPKRVDGEATGDPASTDPKSKTSPPQRTPSLSINAPSPDPQPTLPAATPSSPASTASTSASPSSAPKPPVPSRPAPNLPSIPGGTGGERDAIESPKQSDATSTDEVIDVRPGRPAAAQGLDITTRRATFTRLVRATSAPSSPLIRIMFDASGRAVKVELLESSGVTDVDGPIINAAYLWTARGQAIDALAHQPPGSGVSLVMRILLR